MASNININHCDAVRLTAHSAVWCSQSTFETPIVSVVKALGPLVGKPEFEGDTNTLLEILRFLVLGVGAGPRAKGENLWKQCGALVAALKKPAGRAALVQVRGGSSPAEQGMHIAMAEAAVRTLPRPSGDQYKAAKAVLRLTVSIAKSAATMSIDPNLLTSLQDCVQLAGDELQRHLATQLALLGRACDYVYLTAARLQATQDDLHVMMLQLAVSLLTEECAMSEYIESLTKYASNACTEVLSGIEHQLERTLQGPCEKVAEKVARLLTEESDPSALSKVDGVSRAALGLLQEASPALASAKEGLEKLGRFLEKIHHMLKALASPKQLVGQLAERALLWAIERLQRKCAEIEERLQRKCAEIAEIAEIGALPTVKTVVEKLLHYAKALSSLGALRKGFEMAIFGCMAGGDTGLQSEMGKILRAVGEKLRGALQQIVVKIVFFVVPVDCSKVAEMKVGALREALAQRGLSTDGKRKELQERLLEALEATPAVPTPSKDGADGDSTEGAEPPCVNDALKIVSFDGDSTEGAEPPSVNDAVRLLNDVANFITQGVDKSSIAEANELIQMLDKEVKELVQILGPESVAGNAAITSALLAYKKDATEAQHEEL
ncbi:hypothetical protein Ctob_015968, partial [Chrysochromulina tobinii]